MGIVHCDVILDFVCGTTKEGGVSICHNVVATLFTVRCTVFIVAAVLVRVESDSACGKGEEEGRPVEMHGCSLEY